MLRIVDEKISTSQKVLIAVLSQDKATDPVNQKQDTKTDAIVTKNLKIMVSDIAC